MRRVVISMVLLFALFASNEVVAENIAQGVKVVVIDAGHGGPKYPGATYRGVTEKSLNLQIALKLGALIEKRMPEVKVVYTRKSDMQFSADLNKDLQARAEIANKAGGDIFISIHANAARSTSARGVETLIMGESPLEQRVNESVLFANNKDEFIDMSNEKTAAVVRAYIQNLQFTYGEYSEMMARLIQKNYAKSGRVARGIKRQPLKVLYATDMPSVLTEIGFMSNPDELKYMSSEKGQAEIAENLYNAVKEYSDFVRRSLLVEESPKPTTTAKPAVDVVKSVVPKSEDKAVVASETTANVPIKKPTDVNEVKKVDKEVIKKLATNSATSVTNVERIEVKATTESVKSEPVKPEPEKQPESAKPAAVKRPEVIKQPEVVKQPDVVKHPEVVKAPVAVKLPETEKMAVTSNPNVVKSTAKEQPKSNVTPTQQPKVSGRAFVVQIMASATPLSTNDSRFGNQKGKVNQYTADGAYKYKYCVGRYTDRESAQRAAMSLRQEFNGAFVVEVDGENIVRR
ncbi:MAG: N-acetylmuramoyl-L-alanine amidase [Alistipes sp.]|nr:N-acetylmuramoyl-L-alanine amidase [Alistipes sp.]